VCGVCVCARGVMCIVCGRLEAKRALISWQEFNMTFDYLR